MRTAKLGNKHSEFAKLKIADDSAQAQCVLATYTKTRESKEFTSIKAPRFIGMHHYYVVRRLKIRKIFAGKAYTIT